jgi:hypothetical protein
MGHVHPPLPTETQYIVYCDESRQDASSANPFMGIGGLWVPYQQKSELRKRLDAVASEVGVRGELKWNKVSSATLPAYRAIIDVFAGIQQLHFRAIVVDHARTDYRTYHKGDTELGFYAFYYHMLVKWLVPEASYIVVLDHKVNALPGRYAALQNRLNGAVARSTHIRQVTVADSRESRLAQLADLLTGAVTAAWCGTAPGTAKHDLQDYIARRMGLRSLVWSSPSPAFTRFNVFKINLEAAGGR